MDICQMNAYAKINLGLDVVCRLDNGYHEVRMVMQTVGIYDVLTFERFDFKEGQPQIVITTDSGDLPTDENNLIYKAAKLMIEQYHIREGVRIHLDKHIPIAAGMAGGSADAAATLKGINSLLGLQIPREELMTLGVRIGADVPYCILGGSALAEGIGEKLTVLPAAPSCYLVVAKPDIDVSTRHVYEHLDEEGITGHPDIDGMVAAISEDDLSGVVSRLGNVLEDVTVKEYPIIRSIKERMLELGAKGSLMSGSGPAVYGIFDDEETALSAYQQICEEHLTKQTFITTFVNLLY